MMKNVRPACCTPPPFPFFLACAIENTPDNVLLPPPLPSVVLTPARTGSLSVTAYRIIGLKARGRSIGRLCDGTLADMSSSARSAARSVRSWSCSVLTATDMSPCKHDPCGTSAFAVLDSSALSSTLACSSSIQQPPLHFGKIPDGTSLLALFAVECVYPAFLPYVVGANRGFDSPRIWFMLGVSPSPAPTPPRSKSLN